MPRQPRHWEPNTVVHIISRFVDRSFRLTEETERHRYLRCVSRALKRSDWRPLAYALMSSHIHWVMVAGTAPPHRLLQPAHTGFAQWLNRRQGRFGPVFASRFRAIQVRGDNALALIGYVHNNPVRAGVVTCATKSRWTSHRAFIGLGPRPEWLDVAAAFDLCGLRDDDEGRREFAGFVSSRAAEPRQALWSAGKAIESITRYQLGTSHALAEQVDAQIENRACTVMVALPKHAVLRPRWLGDAQTVIQRVAAGCSIPLHRLLSTSRQRDLVGGRRVALATWRRLGRPASEMAAALGISGSAASRLLATNEEWMERRANEIADSLTDSTP